MHDPAILLRIMPNPPEKYSGRRAAAVALGRAAAQFPDLEPPSSREAPGVGDPRESRLATAITRVAMERWLTLDHLLQQGLTRPIAGVEPALRGVLLAAAAQIAFMDRLPRHAVVDESVKLARSLVRPGAAGLVNAVLRRLCELVQPPVRNQTWSPTADRLPLTDGYVPLVRPVLPDPVDVDAHLSLATSHPRPLIAQWRRTLGDAEAMRLCLHSLQQPPTLVALEKGFDFASAGELISPHVAMNFGIWQGTHAQLVAFLAIHPHRRVQDVGSAAPVGRLEQPPFDAAAARLVVDYCAGRGTKTRQLATLMPRARIVSSDPDAIRLASLRQCSETFENVTVVPHEQLAPEHFAEPPDLVVTDVPCSNTAVLARRPEARYRAEDRTVGSLVRLQRQIVQRAASLLAPGGMLLYATCSLDPRENQEQVGWMTEHLPLVQLFEHSLLPAGRDATYRDGSFAALLQRR